MSKNYRVQYEIDVDADSPQEAAEQAYEFMQHGEAPVLDVVQTNDGRPELNTGNDYYQCAFKQGERIDLSETLVEDDDDEDV